MVLPRLSPVLLIKNKKLQNSRRFETWTYLGGVLNAVRLFSEMGADELVVIDIDASMSGGPLNLDILAKISAQSFVPLAYGGGVNTLQKAKEVIACGIEKVILNQAFFDNTELISEVSKVLGVSSTVVSLDVHNIDGEYKLFNYKTGRSREISLEKAIDLAQNTGAGELLIQDVNATGTLAGINFAQISKVLDKISMPLIYSGGVSGIDDVKLLWAAGVSCVAANTFLSLRPPHNAVLINYPSDEDRFG